jgi:hypothetical protein
VRGVLRPAVAAALAASLGASAPALADCTNGVYDEPLPPTTSIAPAPNAAIEQSYVHPVRFTVVSPIHFVGFSIRVSSRPQLGQTGILSDLVDLDDTILTESASDPDDYFGEASFTAVSLTTWMDVPGTYYWQLFGSWRDAAFTCHAFAGPINTITITPSPPSPPPATPPPPSAPAPAPTPAITAAQARRSAAAMVYARTGRRPRLRLGCTAMSPQSVQCVLRWAAGRSAYRAAGEFTPAGYDVRGTRVRRNCVRRRRCSTRFHWVGP